MKHYTLPPSSFYIGDFEVKYYGVIMAVSMLVGVLLACKLAKKHGVKSDDIYLLALIVLPCAVVGARLYYCVFYESGYSFIDFFKLRKGGLAIYGGVIGGILGIIIFAFVKKDFKIIIKLLDICAPCLIIGQAIGRWGNFFNQEAYGNPVANASSQWFPFSVFIENCEQKSCTCGGSGWHQATFFYESVWNLAGFVVLLLTYYKTKMLGTTTGAYLLWYGVGRTIIEGMRTDSLYIGSTSIRVSQALSIVLVILGLTILVYNIIRKRKLNG